jgi:hypothetical protein
MPPMTTTKPTTLIPTSDATTKLTVMQVAVKLGKRYQKARDMMLAKKFGQPLYIDGKLTVDAKAVDAWLTKQDEKTIQRPEER